MNVYSSNLYTFVQDQNNKLIHSPLTISEILDKAAAKPLFPLERMVEYFGVVNYATNERVLGALKQLIKKYPTDSLYLTVTSAGGPSGTAMSFYDTVESILRPNLTTIGAGDVDSSGLLIFLTGQRRYVTKHTTCLLHRAGRMFDPSQRVTALEMDAMMREDMLKDEHYADIVASQSRGALTKTKVLQLMSANTTLEPEDFVRYGLADEVLS